MKKLRKAKSEIIFDLFNNIGMLLMIVVTLFPFIYILAGSFNNGGDYIKGGVYIWPRVFTTANYKAIFANNQLLNAFGISTLRTIIGTVLAIMFTSLFAYGFSKENLIGKKFYGYFGLFTMFFGGGLIPYYIVLKNLQLIDNFLVYIIPCMFSFFNVIIFTSFFKGIPKSIVESAKMDGASEYTIFLKLILPLSKPVIAAIALFTGVFHWNSFFDAMVFTNSAKLQPIQSLLMKIVSSREFASGMSEQAARFVGKNQTNPLTIQMATMVIASIPIISIYPFFQKYFVKGMLMGSIKE